MGFLSKVTKVYKKTIQATFFYCLICLTMSITLIPYGQEVRYRFDNSARYVGIRYYAVYLIGTYY